MTQREQKIKRGIRETAEAQGCDLSLLTTSSSAPRLETEKQIKLCCGSLFTSRCKNILILCLRAQE